MKKCKYLYEDRCNLKNCPCWFYMSGVEVCCNEYEGEEYNPDDPAHERDIKEK